MELEVYRRVVAVVVVDSIVRELVLVDLEYIQIEQVALDGCFQLDTWVEQTVPDEGRKPLFKKLYVTSIKSKNESAITHIYILS